jgi:Spy/CpxP family protein refolding chaperone
MVAVAFAALGLFLLAKSARRWRRAYGYGHYGGPFALACGGGGRFGEDRDARGFGGRGWRGAGRGGFVLRALLDRIDATGAQEKTIRAALDDLRAKARAVKDDAKASRGDLARAFEGESLDAEVLGAVASRATDAVDALRDATIGALVQVHSVLDARQRAILADLIARGRRGLGGRGSRGPYRDAWV